MSKKFTIQSLGCAKNLCDAEQMLARLFEAGYELVEDPDEADVAIINTCAFIEDAKKESIDTILELAKSRDTGALVAVVVTGCLAERYREEVLDTMPEVDAVIGTASYLDIVEVCDRLLETAEEGHMEQITRFASVDSPLAEAPRVQTTPAYTAYLKIAEGCDNCCSYCVIPALRGRYRSREMDAIVEEATHLVENGVRELIVIAQDITRYGIDLYGEPKLADLLDRLCEIGDLRWIRLHYLYPSDITDGLIDTIARQEKILKYLDIPIQHCVDHILSAMNRRDTQKSIEAVLARLRRSIPGLIIRTTLIVGFPGETREDFATLCSFVERQKFDRLGVFPYSQEEDTVAASLPDQIDEEEKQHRSETVMKIQERVVAKRNARILGTTLTVLVEGYDRAAGCFFGRSYGESPDIDGKVFIYKPEKNRPSEGDFVEVRICEDIDGDLVGELVQSDPA
ncbi:MAG: 30S ribosomal protein S12 methylthiotransferase RimO [Clostridiaceae bacterium]|nr:30S ribosomal protein S12 methylthiotransferase RimO [Clostridiaceae bacterium]